MDTKKALLQETLLELEYYIEMHDVKDPTQLSTERLLSLYKLGKNFRTKPDSYGKVVKTLEERLTTMEKVLYGFENI